MYEYNLLRLSRLLKKVDENKPIGSIHPQEVFGPASHKPKEGEPFIGKRGRHREMSKLIPKVIMEKVNRNGKIFFRRRTVMVRVEDLSTQGKKVEIRLPRKKYRSRYWVYWTMKEYAKRQNFTEQAEEGKRNAVWRDPKMKALYFIYKQYTETPQRTVSVYNNKLRERILLVVVEMSKEEEETGKQEPKVKLEEPKK